MRAIKMHHWKVSDVIITLAGAVGGLYSGIKSMPMLNVGGEFLGFTKACFFAAGVAISSYIGKKIIEENWPALKKFVVNLFKRKPKK